MFEEIAEQVSDRVIDAEAVHSMGVNCEGAFTPDANEALRANDLHVKSMQRRDRQSRGAIRANEAAQITRHELSV